MDNYKWLGVYYPSVMRRSTITDDPRTDALKQAMAGGWSVYSDDYHDDINYEGSTVVYEDDEIAIVADYTGHELSQYLHDHDDPHGPTLRWMRSVAEELTDYDWSDADPLVFDKR